MATIYSKSGADAATAAAIAELNLGTAATADAGDFATAAQGALADATTVEQVTLNANLDYTLSAGTPAGVVHRVTFTQDDTGGHTVTYGGNAVAVESAAGAETLVEIWPGGAVVYPGAAAVSLTGLTLVDNGDGTWTLMSGAVDSVPPSPGTLTASLVTQNTLTLTASGAADAGGLHATPYAFSSDGGTTYSAWQAAATYAVSGLSAGTTYTFRHKVRDAAGNESEGVPVAQATTAGVAFDVAVAGTAGQNSTSATIDLSTATIGATVFMYVARSKNPDPTTVPAGWTLIAPRLEYGTDYRAWCWSKVLGAGDLGVHTWTWAANANRMASQAVAYRGVSGIAVAGSPSLIASYATPIPIATLTTSAPWVLGIASAYYAADGLTVTPADGYTLRGLVGNATSGLYVAACDSNGANAGPTAAPAFTASTAAIYRGGYAIALS